MQCHSQTVGWSWDATWCECLAREKKCNPLSVGYGTRYDYMAKEKMQCCSQSGMSHDKTSCKREKCSITHILLVMEWDMTHEIEKRCDTATHPLLVKEWDTMSLLFKRNMWCYSHPICDGTNFVKLYEAKIMWSCSLSVSLHMHETMTQWGKVCNPTYFLFAIIGYDKISMEGNIHLTHFL